MLRQRGTAALSCAAVRFKGWKLQGMLFPGWAPASEGSSVDLIFQAAPLSVRTVLTALQDLQSSTRFLHHSTCFREQHQHTNGNTSGATDSNTSPGHPARWKWPNTGSQSWRAHQYCSGSPLVNAILLQLSPHQAGMLPPALGLVLCCTTILLETPALWKKTICQQVLLLP